jgi:hypothetical protein
MISPSTASSDLVEHISAHRGNLPSASRFRLVLHRTAGCVVAKMNPLAIPTFLAFSTKKSPTRFYEDPNIWVLKDEMVTVETAPHSLEESAFYFKSSACVRTFRRLHTRAPPLSACLHAAPMRRNCAPSCNARAASPSVQRSPFCRINSIALSIGKTAPISTAWD